MKALRTVDSSLKELLLEAVVAAGNQARLAELVGVDQATVSRWLSDRQGIDVGQCLRLARVTGKPAAEILVGAGHNPEDYLPVTMERLLPDRQDARLRVLQWESRRRALPEHLGPVADRAIAALLDALRDPAEW